MKSKLMMFVFVMTLCLAAAPLALEQLSNLQYVAERWTRNTFLSGIVTAHASEKEAGAMPARCCNSLASQSLHPLTSFAGAGASMQAAQSRSRVSMARSR